MTMKYDYFRVTRQIVAVVAVAFGAAAILFFALATPESLKTIPSAVVVMAWTLFPPIWFYTEYWLLEHGKYVHRPADEHKEAFLGTIKDYADYASKIWAAVLAVLIFLFEARTRKP